MFNFSNDDFCWLDLSKDNLELAWGIACYWRDVVKRKFDKTESNSPTTSLVGVHTEANVDFLFKMIVINLEPKFVSRSPWPKIMKLCMHDLRFIRKTKSWNWKNGDFFAIFYAFLRIFFFVFFSYFSVKNLPYFFTIFLRFFFMIFP